LAQTQVWPAFRYFEAIAPLPPHGQALDRHLDIGVVEDGERYIAAQFQRQFLDRAGALLHRSSRRRSVADDSFFSRLDRAFANMT
jgi:hypothetical protein